MVEKRGGYYCVVHAHPKKAGSDTDQPVGTAIKCYSIAQYGEEGAKKKALAQHSAILFSQGTAK